MRCFYCKNLAEGLLPADAIPDREQKHLFQVLRGKEDSRILLIDGKGSMAEAVIENKHSLNVVEVKRFPSPEKKIHLFVAPPRKNQMDQILKQCAEVGVWSIHPIITKRSVAKPEKETAIERMKILLTEGCKQAHNPFLPDLLPIKKLSDIKEDLLALNNAFFGSTVNCSAPQCIRPDLHKYQLEGDIAWIVGPEGGFTVAEEEFLAACGAKPLQLGQWVMRVETAAIVGAVFLIN